MLSQIRAAATLRPAGPDRRRTKPGWPVSRTRPPARPGRRPGPAAGRTARVHGLQCGLRRFGLLPLVRPRHRRRPAGRGRRPDPRREELTGRPGAAADAVRLAGPRAARRRAGLPAGGQHHARGNELPAQPAAAREREAVASGADACRATIQNEQAPDQIAQRAYQLGMRAETNATILDLRTGRSYKLHDRASALIAAGSSIQATQTRGSGRSSTGTNVTKTGATKNQAAKHRTARHRRRPRRAGSDR